MLHGYQWRIPRFRVTERVAAVVRFQNGLRMAGELHVISRNGGLLVLPDAVDQGTVVQVMFQTHRGPVVGTAEMLMPITRTQQPFRFVGLPEDDHRTLQTAFESGLYRNIDEEERIEELRAAVATALAQWKPRPLRRHLIAKLALGLVALVGCLVCVLYVHLFPL